MIRAPVALVVSVCLALPWGAASAQRSEPPSASSSTGASSEERTRALELYRRSRERYELGDYEQAAALLREAHALHAEPNLLYNLARAYGNVGRFEEAIDAYERFLEAVPDTPDRAVIESRIDNYRATLAEQERREAERQQALERERQRALTESDAGPDPAPWVIAGSGAGVLVAGAVFGGLSLSARDEAENEPSFVPASEASDRAVTFGWVANGAFALGGALAVLGVVWGIVDVVQSSDEDIEESGQTPEVVLSVGPNGLGLTW